MLFNTTDINGRQIEVKTPTKDLMMAALENPQETGDRKELAKEILAWYAAESAKPPLTGNSELDKAAQMSLIEFYARDLWKGTYQLEKRVNGAQAKTVIVRLSDDEVLNW